MRCFILFSFYIGANLAKPSIGKDPSIKEFEAYFHKSYAPGDEAEAEKNLKANEVKIDANNALFEQGQSNFQEGVMAWDDLSHEEFLKEKTGGLDAEPERHFGLLTKNELERYNPPYYMRDELDTWYASKPEPDTSDDYIFDAREHDMVTEVKDQGSCGSCAAFAATSQHETVMLKQGLTEYKDDFDLSEQQLLDCGFDDENALACTGAYIFAYPR